MYKVFLSIFLVLSISLSAHNGRKNRKNDTENKGAFVEAMVTLGANNCGYLLRLSNGQLIKPTNLPKKYQHFDTKVLVMFDNSKEITGSPCDVTKEVTITEIKTYKLTPKSKGKF